MKPGKYTTDDLRRALQSRAATAPDDETVRDRLRLAADHRTSRIRTRSLLAVAATVVLIAGGIGITRTALSHNNSVHPAGPNSDSAVVPVPDVPLADDTQLERFQLDPVFSPVTATAPADMTGMSWIASTERLAVVFFDPETTGGPGGMSGIAPYTEAVTAGYVVTNSADQDTQFPATGGTPAQQKSVTIAGHDGTLTTAAVDDTDSIGSSGILRFTWQLRDDRWIHVWMNNGSASEDSDRDGADTPSDSPATQSPPPQFVAFVSSISQHAHSLPRTVGIGVRLPGLTHDVSINNNLITAGVGGVLSLCPDGVDPLSATSQTAAGSESSAGSATASVEPGDDPGGVIDQQDTPTTACLSVAVLNSDDLPSQFAGKPVTVGGSTVAVDADSGSAMANLERGLHAVVAAPAGAHLATEDLAALAASVRVASDVTVRQSPTGKGSSVGGSSGTAESGVAHSSSVVTSPSLGTAPGIAVGPLAINPNVGVVTSVDSVAKTVTVRFKVVNTSDQTVTMNQLTLVASGLHQRIAGLDQKAFASEPNAPHIASGVDLDDPLPMQIPAGTAIPMRIVLSFDNCADIAGVSAQISADYQVARGGGSITIMQSAGAASNGPSSEGANRIDQGWASQMGANACH